MNEFIQLYNSIIINNSNYDNFQFLYYTANNALSKTEDINAKVFILEKMIILYPNDHELFYKMGKVFKGICFEKELFWYKLSYSIKPDYTENFYDLCELLFENGQINHIFSLNKNNLFEKFMKEPRFLTIYIRCNLSNLKYENGLKSLLDLIKMNSSKQCITEYDKNDKWRNYNDVGYIFCSKCDIENAISYSQKASDLSIKFNLQLDKKLMSFQNVLCFHDFIYNDSDTLFKKYLEINNLIPDKPMFSFKNRKQNKKIKIGYLSSDFIMHAVSNFILPILKNHDKNNFEIFLFANCSEVNIMYTNMGLQIHYIDKISTKEAAEMINKLKIDILFDLNGHTVKNKLEIFTYHPAPIQISYIGYPNTTGLKSIKYRIVDNISDNIQSKQCYSEELIRLPKCFLLFEPIHMFNPKPRKTPEKIILGAINKENKSNNEVLNTWKKILERSLNTIILIKLESVDNKEERTQFYMDKLNIDKTRIIVITKLSNEDYDKVFTRFDILLDSFPYSGTTTTCNSLYNSIPVVTLYNPNYHVHNVSSSLLINSGFPELVANTKDEYIDIVVNLVNNPSKIDKYKKIIRNQFLKLMQPNEFMYSFETELKRVYNDFFTEFKKPILDKPILDKPAIVINFNETIPKNEIVTQIKKVYICGCVKNCSKFLDKVFINIDKIISIFDDYKIILAHDTSSDNSLQILHDKQQNYNIELLNVSENNYIYDSTLRSKRISNSRNMIMDYIKNDNRDDFNYFIMMDMDEVCSESININILKQYLHNNNDWDALSFNRTNYYDIWALSIDPYIFSCWHFPGGFDVVNKIKNYITNKLDKLDKTKLLECVSAFNGFSIYKKDKFKDCRYDWQVKTNYENIYKDIINKNENALGKNITIDKSYHPIINPTTDCEHRYFHMKAIQLNSAKIRISPLCLF